MEELVTLVNGELTATNLHIVQDTTTGRIEVRTMCCQGAVHWDVYHNRWICYYCKKHCTLPEETVVGKSGVQSSVFYMDQDGGTLGLMTWVCGWTGLQPEQLSIEVERAR